MLRKYLLASLLLSLQVGVLSAQERTNAPIAKDRQLMDRIVAELHARMGAGELKQQDLVIAVENGHVTVDGQVDEPSEARLILDSVLAADGVSGLEFKVRTPPRSSPAWGQAIAPRYDLYQLRKPLRWDDGDWHLDFGAKPIRYRTRQATEARDSGR